jgi:hypothetical protein
MGLDCTIFRADGAPLGDRETVVKILRRHFHSVEFGWTPSGVDKLAAMKSQGIEPPEILREHLSGQPPKYEGVYDGPGWSAQFLFGHGDPIKKLEVVLRGETNLATEVIEELVSKTGWSVSRP